jgi:hypothetical protein
MPPTDRHDLETLVYEAVPRVGAQLDEVAAEALTVRNGRPRHPVMGLGTLSF